MKPDSLERPAKSADPARVSMPAPVHTIDVTPTTVTAPIGPVDQIGGSESAAAGAKSPSEPQAQSNGRPVAPVAPTKILVIDIGGTKVKMLETGQTEPIKFPSGKEFTPAHLVEAAKKHAKNWDYEAVSIGYPGLVGAQGPRSEPGNLGSGWVGFDFAAAFGKPVKMTNDAAMQALGSYEGGRMLFLGLGTGLGSTLITGHMIIPLELGRMIYDKTRTLGDVLGRQGLRLLGKNKWRNAVNRIVTALMRSFVADYVVIGGGNAKKVDELPPGTRLGHNLTAFRGGFRLWSVEDVWVLASSGEDIPQPVAQEALRIR